MKFDKSKTTSLEDMDSQYDYMIDKGIFRKPKVVQKDFKDKGIVQIESDWFKDLSKENQERILSKATKDWWDGYGK